MVDIFAGHICLEDFAFLGLDCVRTFSQPHPERSAPSFDTHICIHTHTHDLVYKADTTEIKRKEGLEMRGFHSNTETIKSSTRFLLQRSPLVRPGNVLFNQPSLFFIFLLFHTHLSPHTRVPENLFPMQWCGFFSFLPLLPTHSWGFTLFSQASYYIFLKPR